MNDGQNHCRILAPHPPHLIYGENPPQSEPRSQGGWEALRDRGFGSVQDNKSLVGSRVRE